MQINLAFIKWISINGPYRTCFVCVWLKSQYNVYIKRNLHRVPFMKTEKWKYWMVAILDHALNIVDNTQIWRHVFILLSVSSGSLLVPYGTYNIFWKLVNVIWNIISLTLKMWCNLSILSWFCMHSDVVLCC